MEMSKNFQCTYLTVYGKSTLFVKPNLAEINLGVVTNAKDAQTAQQENAAIMEQVLAAVSQRVPEENIQTADYALFPQYSYENGSQTLVGYEVSHMISIKITNLDIVGDIIDTAFQNGANKMTAIQFTLTNPNSYYQQALQLAVLNGYEKANTLTQTIQARLHPLPCRMNELTISPPPQPFFSVTSAEAASVSTPIEPGQIKMEASLEMVFMYYR